MTQRPALDSLTEDIARAVAELPGVAFLKPDLAGRLRSTLARARAGRPPASSAVRLTRPNGGADTWHVEVHVVARERERTVDVARAARHTAAELLAAALPGDASRARVTVTVSGLV
ncbi:hypothetical protein [Streptomyces sp. NPDC102360]|uniref:hypothetical protein n=1 Tax=Streptomyces sp. NPDC102360 TaxID=3366160 RepID=UPI00380A88C6